MNLAAVVFGLLIASAAGSLYHLVRGGPLSRLVLYLACAWVAFAGGHFVGVLLDLSLLRVGAINMFAAVLATLLALLLADALAPPLPDRDDRKRPDPPLTPRP